MYKYTLMRLAKHIIIYFNVLKEKIKCCVKARLHGSPRLINAVESTKLNSTVERYCLHSSIKVNEAVDFKMAANELVREGVVVICDYLLKECQHILDKKEIKGKNDVLLVLHWGTGRDLLVDTGSLW